MKLYIYDVTIKDYMLFDTLPSLVNHAEKILIKKFNKTKTQYLNEQVELGASIYNDPNDYYFLRSLSEYMNMGVFKNGKFVKCDLTELAFEDPNFGD